MLLVSKGGQCAQWLNALPDSQQARAQKCDAGNRLAVMRADAVFAFNHLVDACSARYAKLPEQLTEDHAKLLAFSIPRLSTGSICTPGIRSTRPPRWSVI